MERDDWQLCLESRCFDGAAAVVVVDGREMVTDDSRGAGRRSSFRPSFPTGDLR